MPTTAADHGPGRSPDDGAEGRVGRRDGADAGAEHPAQQSSDKGALGGLPGVDADELGDGDRLDPDSVDLHARDLDGAALDRRARGYRRSATAADRDPEPGNPDGNEPHRADPHPGLTSRLAR